MAAAAKSLNSWLQDGDKAPTQKLMEAMRTVEDAPQLRCFKHCDSVDEKVRFLWALSSVVNAVLDDKGPIGIRAKSQPKAADLARHLQQTFFQLPECGDVLGSWHSGRLERYNAAYSRAGKRAAERLKSELQAKLVAALRSGAAAAPTVAGKARPTTPQLELRDWPMAGCPLARAFLDFVALHRKELTDAGHPSLGDCPPHSLQPSTLRKLIRRLDALEVVPSEPIKGRRAGHGIVRLRSSTGETGSDKATAAAPSTAVGVPTSASPTAGSRNQTAAQTGTPTATTPKAVAAPKLVRRRVNWDNASFLRRVIRAGLNDGDPEWVRKWQNFAKAENLSSDLDSQQEAVQHKDALAEFVEENLAVLLKRPWAKCLMYKVEGASDELPPESQLEGAAKRGGPAGAHAPSGVKRAAPGGGKGPDVIVSTSDSEDGGRGKKKRRKKDPKKFPKGYGQYSMAEAMMMNQMMNYSMMGMGMMGMGHVGMMPTMVNVDSTAGAKAQRPDERGKRPMVARPGGSTRNAREQERKRKNDNMINTDDL